MQYTMRFDSGKYSVKAYMASDAGDPGTVLIYINDAVIGESGNVTKEAWQAYEWYDVGEFSIDAGQHVVKTEFPTGNLNIAALEFTRVGDSELAPAETEAPPAEESPAGDDGAADEGDGADATQPPANNNSNTESDDGGNNMVIIIIIGAVVLVVIIVILVVVTKKKKAA